MRRSLLTLLPFVTGCYTYALIEPSTAQPGTDVRAHVSAAAAERLTPLLGRVDDRLVSGTLIANEAQSVLIEVPKIVPANAGAVETLNQRVSIARSDLIGLETRTLDRVRTGAVAGGVALVIAVAVIKALRGQESSVGSRPGGTTELRIPLGHSAP